MSDHEQWNTNQPDSNSCGTRSSQETLYNTDDGNNIASNSNTAFSIAQPNGSQSGTDDEGRSLSFTSFQSLSTSKDVSMAPDLSQCILDNSIELDEDARMPFDTTSSVMGGSFVASPGDMGMPGDVSSPFETMESDDTGMESETQILTGGKRLPPDWGIPPQSTTTPGGSSDEDPYASNHNRKKRKKTRKDMHPFYNMTKVSVNSPRGSQIPSPSPSYEAGANETEDSSAPMSMFNSVPRSKQTYNTNFNNSDSSLNALMSRRLSNASESSQNTSLRDVNLLTEDMNSQPSECRREQIRMPSSSRRRAAYHHRGNNANPAMNLNVQQSSSSHGCSLEIIAQPEEQHRARYLTEGSRGPVKDASQQGYPRLELKGYPNKTTLQVFVGMESDEKIKPHGFYQACKVTGRNTTPCEEIDINGTKVIAIPFDSKEPISVDCVGILKLRNADVEARIGVTRAKKRNQTVRLVFRVILDDVPNAPNSVILQVASNKISCTQPPGQPEITKKSLDRCSVKGDYEMFIIGRNFHKGTKVIFQDPEEADGTHWRMEGVLDRDNFHQTHMVVKVPPYHDLGIIKPVNVQVFVEHSGKKCEPHSFTYDPIKPAKGSVHHSPVEETENATGKQEEDSSMKALLGGNIDRKVLEALMKLLKPEVDANDVKPTITTSQIPQTSTSGNNGSTPSFSPIQSLPIVNNNNNPLPVVERPRPIQGSMLSTANFVFSTNQTPLTLNTSQSTAFCNTQTLNQVGAFQTNFVNQPVHPGTNFQSPLSNLLVKTESPNGSVLATGFPTSSLGQNSQTTVSSCPSTVVFSSTDFPIASYQKQTASHLPVSQDSQLPAAVLQTTQQSSMQTTSDCQSSLFSTLQTEGAGFMYSNEATPNSNLSESIHNPGNSLSLGDQNMQTTQNSFLGVSSSVESAQWSAAQINIATPTFDQNSKDLGFLSCNLMQQDKDSFGQVISTLSPQENANAGVSDNFVWPSQNQMAFTSTQSTDISSPHVETVQTLAWSKEAAPSNVTTQPISYNAGETVFTIAESIQFLEQAANEQGAMSMSQEHSSSPLNKGIGESHPDVLQSVAASVKNGEALMGSPPPAETGLSIGFDNKFSLNETTVMSQSKSMETSSMPPEILQVILSDCQPQHIASSQPDFTGSSFSNVNTTSLTNPQINPTNGDPPSLFNTSTNSNQSFDIASQQQIQSQFQPGSNINMVPVSIQSQAPLLAQDKTGELPKHTLNVDDLDSFMIMDTNMYLVNPNEVQPPARQEENFQHNQLEKQVQHHHLPSQTPSNVEQKSFAGAGDAPEIQLSDSFAPSTTNHGQYQQQQQQQPPPQPH